MSGPALIIVTLCLSVVFLLAGNTAVQGSLTYRSTLQKSRLLRNQYTAESQLSQQMWNLVYDMRSNGRNRQLGYVNPDQLEEDEEPRVMADGLRPTELINDKLISISIEDANRGFDFSGTLTGTKLREIQNKINLNETGTNDTSHESVEDFLASLKDYVDRDDGYRVDGKGAERGDYEVYDLPRNGNIEYPEEVLWIPGVREALFANHQHLELESANFSLELNKVLRPIAPRGSKDFAKNAKPNFFSASDYELMNLANLTEDQLQEVMEARRLWYDEKISLQESLPELYNVLKNHFSFIESGVYRFRIVVADNDGSSPAISEAVIDLKNSMPSIRPDTFSGWKYWRKTNF